MSLPGCATALAGLSRKRHVGYATGRRIVDLVRKGIVPRQILTRAAFENAIRTLAAIGGSTNAVIHLLAIAGRLGVPLTLASLDRHTLRRVMIRKDADHATRQVGQRGDRAAGGAPGLAGRQA